MRAPLVRLAARTAARAGMAAAAAAAFGAQAEPATYAVDPTHTQVHVELRVGLATVVGRFDRSRGEARLDRGARSGDATLALDAASFNTGSAALDTLLRGPALLDAARHAEIGFRAGRLVFDGERLVAVGGTLQLRGAEHPLSFDVRRFGCYSNPLLQRQVCGGDFVADVPRAALGLQGGPDELGPMLRIVVQLEAIRS